MGAFEEIVDLTHKVDSQTLPFPGDPAACLKSVAQMATEGFCVTQVTLATHTATHVDAPAHVIEGGRSLGEFALSDFLGTAFLLDATGCRGNVEEELLKEASACDWLLVCTGQSRKWGSEEYFRGPVFSEGFVRGAARLARKGIGLDCAGLDSQGVFLHRLWFSSGTGLIVENLCGLEALIAKRVRLFAAVPLKLDAADGAPVRAFAVLERDEN